MRKVECDTFGLAIDRENMKVMMKFSENISLLTMDPDEAQRLGVAIIYAAESLKHMQAGEPSGQKSP